MVYDLPAYRPIAVIAARVPDKLKSISIFASVFCLLSSVGRAAHS